MFLPPRTTSVIQPCDQGIIRNLKGHYRSQVVHKIIDDIDADDELSANSIAKKLTLLDAIHMLRKAWNNVTSSTIVNCFRKGGFFKPDVQQPVESDNSDDTNFAAPTGLTNEAFQQFISHDDTLDCHQPQTDEEICAAFTQQDSTSTTVNESDDSDNDDHDYLLPVTNGEVKTILGRVRRFLEENGCEDFDRLYQLEDLCETTSAANRRQRTSRRVIMTRVH
ncbi:jerky protein homolog-like [Gigantopelta aegis]|uniref:jerky protein homolog-like n=1 Tax=Gigantopelta aegis TaxID=1735272 RepID=UPI001B888C16|nr:jerky protein homolog-like [Gigantopelta aegis]